MAKFIVLVSDGKIGGAGLVFDMAHEVRVEAADERDAYNRVKAQDPTKRIKSVEQIMEYHLTVKGKEDGRKRETFIIKATSEKRAISYLGYNNAALRFAGFKNIKKPIKIVVKDA